MNQKPYSEACVKNRDPILAVLRQTFNTPGTIVEIGSGTGQHAHYFAQHMPHLIWQATDVADNLAGIRSWLDEDYDMPNCLPPAELDVTQSCWTITRANGVFSANTAHIMSWAAVKCMFTGIGNILSRGGYFCLYGPFNYNGQYTSDSNARFDSWLKARDPDSGVRDYNDLERLARDSGLILQRDIAMPANNRTLVWQKE